MRVLIFVFAIVIPIPIFLVVSHTLLFSINYTEDINQSQFQLVQQLYNYSMGNCQKKDDDQTVTNFDNDKWCMKASNINSHCFILKNNYHPNVKLLKWISNSKNQNRIEKWRQQKKSQYLLNIYEKGETRLLHHELKQQNRNNYQSQKRVYVVTEQLIRLKDIKIKQSEAIIIAYKCLLAYSEIMRQLGGFIAKQNMIYINRQGIVKVWIHQNLANNSLQFPHPAISQQEFIQSLLHQIFTLSQSNSKLKGYSPPQPNSFYEYLKTGPMKFHQMKQKLFSYIQQNGLDNTICIEKQIFDRILDSYENKENKKNKKDKNKQNEDESSLNKLKFIVGDSQKSSHRYVKDYSQKTIYDNFNQNNTFNPIVNHSFEHHPTIEQYDPLFVHPMNHTSIILNETFI